MSLVKKHVVIIGAGPSGLSLACLLSELGLKITLIDKQSLDKLKNPDYDGRETALTHPSKNLLDKIGAWDKIDKKFISKIKGAKVLNGFSPYSLDFDVNEVEISELGYFVSNQMIKKALFEKAINIKNIEIITETEVIDIKNNAPDKAEIFLSNNKTIECCLAIAADSRFSSSRKIVGISANMHDFARNMVLCKMKHEKDHKQIALECFYSDRVMAALPLNNNESSIVITLPTKEAKALVNLSDEEFNENVTGYLGNILGNVEAVSERYSYPLVSTYANKFISARFALVGDAAVGMHPVTAHGYNLGLSGQNTLCNLIKETLDKGEDIGSKEVLEKYHKQHLKETKIMYHGTNAIVSIFTNNKTSVKILRNIMLRAANSRFLPFKSIISNRLTGKE